MSKSKRGTIVRSDDGEYWVGNLTYIDKDGRKVEEKFSAKSKSTVESEINSRRRAINTSKLMAERTRLTLADAAEEYFKKTRKYKLPETDAQAMIFMAKYHDLIIWQTKIREMNDELLVYTANYMLTDGCTIPEIRCFFKWVHFIVKMYSAASGFYVNVSLFPGKYDRKFRFVMPVCFTLVERRRFFKEAMRIYPDSDNVPYYRLGSSLMFMMHTGLFANEFVALAGNNISRGEVRVNKHVLVRNETNGVIVKDKCSRRVKLSTSALNMSQSLVYSSPRYFPDGFTGSGAVKLLRSLNEAYTAVLKNIGFDKKYAGNGLSVLRNTFAANCINNDCPINELSAVLGHPDESYTRTLYAGVIKWHELRKMEKEKEERERKEKEKEAEKKDDR